MPLINCPDCGKEISNKTKACVHCGYREAQTIYLQELGFDGKIFRMVVAVGIICFLIGVVTTVSQGFFAGWLELAIGFGIMALGTLFLLIRSLR